ncbi:MAG: FAD-binding oxidoreductase [Dehalococcoidia bacterium]
MGSASDEFYKEAEKVVGKGNITAEKEDIVVYCRDEVSQALKSYMADYAVIPESTEQVQALVKLANKYQVALYPYSYGTNLSGATSPRKGGAIVVMRKMDRILEINEETKTATIESGVTWSKLIHETGKVGLEPLPLGGGPHTGGPVGNYSLGGGPTGAIDMNEVVSLEIVLGNGEILRTGSAAFVGHEEINPYFRIAWGPNLTELYRGAMGTFGIITKMIRRLYPIRAIEEPIQIGFPDLSTCVEGMRNVVELGICKQVTALNRIQGAAIAAESDLIKDPVAYKELEDSLAAWLMMAKISCYNEEQASVYRKLIIDAITRAGGSLVQYEGDVQRNLTQLWGGSSVAALHYLRHEPNLMAFFYVPPSRIVGAYEITMDIMKKLDYPMTSFSGNVPEPRMYLAPWERTETFMIEFDVEFDPLDQESINKFRQFMGMYFEATLKYGSAQASAGFFRNMEAGLLPSYTRFLRDIKNAIDPNHVMAPSSVFKDM